MNIFLMLHRGLHKTGRYIAALTMAVLALVVWAAPAIGAFIGAFYAGHVISSFIGGGIVMTLFIAIGCIFPLICFYVVPHFEDHTKKAGVDLMHAATDVQDGWEPKA